MKRIIFTFWFLAIIAACTSPQSRNTAGSSVDDSSKDIVFDGPYSLWGEDWAFRFSTVNKWVMQWEDAYKYEANAYFTLNGAAFTDSNTVISFYIFKYTDKDLSSVVNDDIEKFYSDYPGIRIEKFNFKDMNYDYYISEKKYPLKKNDKIFESVMYDFTNSTVDHFDRYEFVVFFKISPEDENVCVLQLSSVDEDIFNYIEDVKYIFMTFEKGEIPEKETFYE